MLDSAKDVQMNHTYLIENALFAMDNQWYNEELPIIISLIIFCPCNLLLLYHQVTYSVLIFIIIPYVSLHTLNGIK